MNEFIHTTKVPNRILSLYTSLTNLYGSYNDFKNEPTQSNLDSFTQAAADFEAKTEMVRQTIAMSVKEIVGEESENKVDGQKTSNGVAL